MGADEWRDEREWPLARTRWTRFYLHSQGQANSLNGDGRLSAEAPAEEPPDRFEYDPADPVPTIGGRGLLPVAAGIFDHSELEQRPDILVYSTSPLTEDVEVTGPVVLNLWAATLAVDTDFTARFARRVSRWRGLQPHRRHDPIEIPARTNPAWWRPVKPNGLKSPWLPPATSSGRDIFRKALLFLGKKPDTCLCGVKVGFEHGQRYVLERPGTHADRLTLKSRCLPPRFHSKVHVHDSSKRAC